MHKEPCDFRSKKGVLAGAGLLFAAAGGGAAYAYSTRNQGSNDLATTSPLPIQPTNSNAGVVVPTNTKGAPSLGTELTSKTKTPPTLSAAQNTEISSEAKMLVLEQYLQHLIDQNPVRRQRDIHTEYIRKLDQARAKSVPENGSLPTQESTSAELLTRVVAAMSKDEARVKDLVKQIAQDVVDELKGLLDSGVRLGNYVYSDHPVHKIIAKWWGATTDVES